MRVRKVSTTLKSLREAGYWVEVTHERYVKILGLQPVLETVHNIKQAGGGANVLPNGGRVTAVIKDKQGGTVLAIGEATCALEDGFRANLGTAIALGRAMERLPVDLGPPIGGKDRGLPW